MTVIAGVGTALGAHAYPQDEITDAFVAYVLGDAPSRGPRACSTASTPTAGSGPGTSRCRWRTTRALDGFTDANDVVVADVGGRARRAGRPRGPRRAPG